MAEIVVMTIMFGIPAIIVLGVIQMFKSIYNWLKNRQETSLESQYLQHIQLSQLEESRKRSQTRSRHRLDNQKRQLHHRRRLGRQLQLAFMQLPSAPDAQRLFSWTKQCIELPLGFRRRQFSRFQRILMEQIPRWLDAGVEKERLEADLRAIVRNMGVAKFEADYMINTMNPNRPLPTRSEAEAFAGQLSEIQADHQRRKQTIEAMTGLDPDVKAELIDAEDQRYRAMLFGRQS